MALKEYLKFPLLCYVILALFFQGCSNNDQLSGESKNLNTSDKFNQTPINWIGTWQNRESKKNLVNSAVREFEIQHQDIKVNIKYQEEFCGGCKDARVIMQDSIINMIKNENFNWDIIPLTAKYYHEIAVLIDDDEWGKKYLVNFEEFEWFKSSHISQVFEVEQYRNDFGGIFTGPLIEGRNYGLWFNTETAKKLGIEIKRTGMTYADFLGYCIAVENYNKTATDKITFFSEYKVSEQITDIFNNLVLSDVGAVIETQPDRKIALAAIKKTALAVEELAKHNAINPSVQTDKDFIYSLEGKVLFTVQASSWINQCETENKEKALLLVPAELPIYNKSAEIYRGSFQSVWAIFKNAPHRNQAIELMKYISSNDVAERWLSTTFNPTGLKVRLNTSDFGQNEIEKFNNYIQQKYGKNLKNYDLGKLLFNKKIDKNYLDPYKVFKGEISADEYYSKLVSQL